MNAFMSNITLLTVLMNIVWVSLLLCSIAMLSVIIERFIYFQIVRKKDEEFSKKIFSFITSKDFNAANAYCEAMATPLSNIIKSALSFKEGESVKEKITAEAQKETPKIERFVSVLSTLSTIAPLLGLLGTILGMIESFSVIAREGTGTSPLLANGISNALLTTAAGLFIAIPSVLAYNYFVNSANRRIAFMENVSNEAAEKIESVR